MPLVLNGVAAFLYSAIPMYVKLAPLLHRTVHVNLPIGTTHCTMPGYELLKMRLTWPN